MEKLEVNKPTLDILFAELGINLVHDFNVKIGNGKITTEEEVQLFAILMAAAAKVPPIQAEDE
jgi:hypothetical protein